MSAEDDRALAYMNTQRARTAHTLANERRLHGDPAVRKAVVNAWAPLILALQEQATPPPRDDDQC